MLPICLSTLNLAQLANEDLRLGDVTSIHIVELKEEFDPKPIYDTVRNLYVATVKNML